MQSSLNFPLSILWLSIFFRSLSAWIYPAPTSASYLWGRTSLAQPYRARSCNSVGQINVCKKQCWSRDQAHHGQSFQKPFIITTANTGMYIGCCVCRTGFIPNPNIWLQFSGEQPQVWQTCSLRRRSLGQKADSCTKEHCTILCNFHLFSFPLSWLVCLLIPFYLQQIPILRAVETSVLASFPGYWIHLLIILFLSLLLWFSFSQSFGCLAS